MIPKKFNPSFFLVASTICYLVGSFSLSLSGNLTNPLAPPINDSTRITVDCGIWEQIETPTLSPWLTIYDYDGTPNDNPPDYIFSEWLPDYEDQVTLGLSPPCEEWPIFTYKRQRFDIANKVLEEQTKVIVWRFIPREGFTPPVVKKS